jgi:hypothetical protein
MPSGFQQDPNQLQPAYFRVVMDMSNNDIYPTGNADGAGAVNPYSWDNFTGTDLPSTLDNAIRLAQGNIRFQRIIEELTKYSDAQIIDLECISGGDPITGNDTPTALAFTVRYDRFGIDDNNVEADSPLLAMEQKYLRSINDGSIHSPYDNENITHTNEAIQEAIMRALIENVTRSVRVFVPVEGSDPLVGEGTQQKVQAGDVTDNENEVSYSDLRNTITVNAMDGTTLISTDNNADVAP